jgi:hypothetical protein
VIVWYDEKTMGAKSAKSLALPPSDIDLAVAVALGYIPFKSLDASTKRRVEQTMHQYKDLVMQKVLAHMGQA